MRSIYELRAEEKGRERGMQQGLQQGQRELLVRLLTNKYGALSESAIARIDTMTDSEMLVLSDRLFSASNINELGLPS